MSSPPIYRNRDFVLLWVGQLVSETGDRVYSLALMWWALITTGSALKMGTVMAFWAIPFVVLGPVAGAYVDRHNRKGIIVGMDVARGIIVVIVATLAFMNRLLLWHVYLAISFESIGTAFFMPAVTATIPNIVSKENLTKANSLSQLVRSVVGVAGPALGGLLIAIVGIPAVFLINGISYLLSASSETFIRVPPLTRKIENQKHIIRETYDGFRFIRSDSMLFGLVSVSCILNFFAAPIIVLIPVLVKQILHLGVKHVGFLEAAMSLGIAGIAVILAAVPEIRQKHRPIIWGVFFDGVFIALSGIILKFQWILVFFILFGIFNGLCNINARTLLQNIVPDERRGRVFGALTTINMGLNPVGYMLAGFLADILTVPVVFVIAGLILAIGGLYLYSIPGIRKV